jgi:hypothetical protein
MTRYPPPPGFFLDPQNWWALSQNPDLPAYPWTPSREISEAIMSDRNQEFARTQENSAQGLLDYAGLGLPISALNMPPAGLVQGAQPAFATVNSLGELPQRTAFNTASMQNSEDFSQPALTRALFGNQTQPLGGNNVGGSRNVPQPDYGKPKPGGAFDGNDRTYAQSDMGSGTPFRGRIPAPSAGQHLASRLAYREAVSATDQHQAGNTFEYAGFKFATIGRIHRGIGSAIIASGPVHVFDPATNAYATIDASPTRPVELDEQNGELLIRR